MRCIHFSSSFPEQNLKKKKSYLNKAVKFRLKTIFKQAWNLVEKSSLDSNKLSWGKKILMAVYVYKF